MLKNTVQDLSNLTQEEKVSILSHIHDGIKNHPYRIEFDEAYMKPYIALLYKLSDAFYECIKNTIYSNAQNMLHDFNSAIFNLIYYADKKDIICHIERCIGIIHRFISTGVIPIYYTYYTGVSILKSKNRLTVYVFDDTINKYIPRYSEMEVSDFIAEIEDYKYHNGIFGNEYSPYSKTAYDYFVNYRNRFYTKESNKNE